ncbi:MAG: zinc-binding dehydrogenase, partial [Streptomyces sp.]|nr:zinc-binding dehydrogenase [Streptomyces sp.]
VGEGVDAGWIGRRVWAFTGLSGGYAEQAVAAVEDVLPLPDGLTGAAAVALGGSGVVAHFALDRARFAPGETVLVRGAAGSIGITAVQLAASGGAGAVAVTTSSAERGALLRDLGASHVLDRSGEGGPDAPAGFDVVIDVVAGAELPLFLDRLNSNGRYVAVGVVGGPPPADFGMRLMGAFRKSVSYAVFSSDTVPGPVRQAVRSSQFADAERGGLRAVVHEVLPLDQAVRAHRAMDEGTVFGRVVLAP